MKIVQSIPVFLLLATVSSATEQKKDSSTIMPAATDTISVAPKVNSTANEASSEADDNLSVKRDLTAAAPASETASTESEPTEVSSTESAGGDTLQKASALKSDSKIKATSSIVEETEEELILEGGEESILAPAVVEIPPQSAPPTDSTDSITSDAVVTDSSTKKIDSTAVEQQQEPVFQYPSAAMPKIDEQPPQPARIEKMQSINFAKNYKEYRSPKLAILLSLLVPGAGQAYAHNLLKTGIFGAVEVAFITVGAIIAYQGKKKRDDARAFADKHYSVDSFTVYYQNLKTQIPEADSIVFGFEIHPDTFVNRDARGKNQDFYNTISHEVSPYIQGWDDVRPRFDEYFEPINDEHGMYVAQADSIFLVYQIFQNGDSSLAQYGFSENIKAYNRQLSKSNSFFRASERLFTIMLLNHAISAIDAAITAKAYNDGLLGKKSVWQRFNIREQYVNTPSGPANGFALEVRF